MTATIRVQDRTTGALGDLINAERAPMILGGNGEAGVAIVKWDSLPGQTWAEWRDLAW